MELFDPKVQRSHPWGKSAGTMTEENLEQRERYDWIFIWDNASLIWKSASGWGLVWCERFSVILIVSNEDLIVQQTGLRYVWVIRTDLNLTNQKWFYIMICLLIKHRLCVSLLDWLSNKILWFQNLVQSVAVKINGNFGCKKFFV